MKSKIPSPAQLQKELLKEVAKHANTLSLQDIKESWEITGIIADKQQALHKELQSYNDEIHTSKEQLKALRTEASKLKEVLALLESKKHNAKAELAKLEEELSVKSIVKQKKQDHDDIHESSKQMLPSNLKSVQIYLKDGSIAKAKPAQKLFSEDLYKKYRVSLKENRTLKIQLSKLELENKQMHIELRDFYTDLTLESMNARDFVADSTTNPADFAQDFIQDSARQDSTQNFTQDALIDSMTTSTTDSTQDFVADSAQDSAIDSNELSPLEFPPLESKEILATEEDLNDFKQMLKKHKDKKEQNG